MTPNTSPCGPELTEPSAMLSRDLQRHLALCEEAMEMTMRENQALAGSAAYEPFEFYQLRKDLLPRLEQSLIALRFRRQEWQKLEPSQRTGGAEISALMQTAQGLLMKVLMLDRENQQALLRRGLVPARHLPASAAQQPHCVADLYRRHSVTARPA
jgi:hypothetical protein